MAFPANGLAVQPRSDDVASRDCCNTQQHRQLKVGRINPAFSYSKNIFRKEVPSGKQPGFMPGRRNRMVLHGAEMKL
jgi:hypothetical protein